MELQDALSHIAEIRARVAATEQFRGVRAAPVAFSGMLAILAAILQPTLVPNPAENLAEYLALWISVAILAMALSGIRILVRDWYEDHSISRHLTRLAMGQFAPCVLVGGMVTIVLARQAPNAAWMLPGLWPIFLAMGIWASCRWLPPATVWVGLMYFAAGILNLAIAQGENAYAPWAMGVPFGLGQLTAAGILYWNLERNHGSNS